MEEKHNHNENKIPERNRYVNNFAWRTLEHVGARGVGLLVSMILARMLLAEEYGEVAIITVILNILSVFVDSGFAHALIQKKDADELDFSSVFFFNLSVCVVLYILMFAAAPFIAAFYRMEHLKPVIRVQSLLLIISGVKSIQTAYVAKHMIFKRFFFATLGGTVGAAVIGIWMAYRGYGVWALVAQSLFNNTLDTIILWITVKWRPTRQFSFARLKILFGFGSKLLLATLIDKSYWEVRQLFIGRVYTSADLAYFNKGGALPNEIYQTINNGLGDILFPAMSTVQDDIARLKAWVKKSILLHSFLFCPMMFGLASIAKPLITVLFSDRWLEAVPYFQVLCLMYLFTSVATPNVCAAKALGHSEVLLRINYIRAPLHLLGLFLTIHHSVMAVAIAAVVTTNIGCLLCACSSKKLFTYPLWRQITDMLPHLLLSLFMAGCVWTVTLLGWNAWLTLIIQVSLGVVLYVGGSLVLKFEMLPYTYNLAKEYLRRFRERSKKNDSI